MPLRTAIRSSPVGPPPVGRYVSVSAVRMLNPTALSSTLCLLEGGAALTRGMQTQRLLHNVLEAWHTLQLLRGRQCREPEPGFPRSITRQQSSAERLIARRDLRQAYLRPQLPNNVRVPGEFVQCPDDRDGCRILPDDVGSTVSTLQDVIWIAYLAAEQNRHHLILYALIWKDFG